MTTEILSNVLLIVAVVFGVCGAILLWRVRRIDKAEVEAILQGATPDPEKRRQAVRLRRVGMVFVVAMATTLAGAAGTSLWVLIAAPVALGCIWAYTVAKSAAVQKAAAAGIAVSLFIGALLIWLTYPGIYTAIMALFMAVLGAATGWTYWTGAVDVAPETESAGHDHE